MLCLFGLANFAAANNITVETTIDQDEVFVGEPFTMQITVNGAESPSEPDLSKLQGLQVLNKNGSNQSSSYSININGRLQTTKNQAYTYSYTLKADRPGQLIIPALTIMVDGKQYHSTPKPITVKIPQEIKEYKLRVSLSNEKPFVGEATTLTTTWYIGQDFKGFEFNLPIFTDSNFHLSPIEPSNVPQQNLIKLEINGQEITGQKRETSLDGQQYLAVSFQHQLICNKVGRHLLPQGSVAISAFAGYAQQSRRNIDPFSMFGGGNRKTYKTVVIPANPQEIEVQALPQKDQPANFSGLVGQYEVMSQATPNTMNVGDPIKFSLTFSGPAIDRFDLPQLQAVLPNQDFKISKDKPETSQLAASKTFTTTIRARHDGVTAIPAFILDYFDPKTKKYKSSQAPAIPITVRPTKTITALDAEGIVLGQEEPSKAPTSLEANNSGIRHNYIDISFEKQDRQHNIFWLIIAIWPTIWLLATIFRKSLNRSPVKSQIKRQKQAKRKLQKALKKAKNVEERYSTFLDFIGDKLLRPGRTITLSDLQQAMPPGDQLKLLEEIEKIFQQGEGQQYGGAQQDATALSSENIQLITSQINKVIKWNNYL